MISTEWLTAGRRLKVLVGHYGSGKTELAVNMALRLAQTARTMLIDLDIVNPFFRSAEVKPLLQENGVEVVYPAYALSGVDIPILPAEVERAFTTDGYCVFDVGGDDDGAVALGRYHAQFSACPADVYFVVNPFRPRTARVGQALALMEAIERRTRAHHRAGRQRQPRRGDHSGGDPRRARFCFPPRGGERAAGGVRGGRGRSARAPAGSVAAAAHPPLPYPGMDEMA